VVKIWVTFTPVSESGKSYDVSNYRLISLTLDACKFMERESQACVSVRLQVDSEKYPNTKN